MGHLRLVHSARSAPTAENACLDGFDRELDYVFETLQRLGARSGEIEHLAQEVFLELCRSWPIVDTSRPLRPYLFEIAFRVVSAQRRRRGRAPRYASLDHEHGAIAPERSLQSEGSIALLSAALERVPPRRRAVVVLHDIDGLGVADVARTLSITRFGTRVRLRKGRKELARALRRLLGGRGGE